jgi:antitoxin component YwqK of YwqJK toxin-antitoxin module
VIGQTLDGEMDGTWKEYYNNGQLQAHSLNNMGKCISKKIWKINGELCPESHVENGRGQFMEYKENGEPLKIRIVKDGVEID